MIASMKHGSVVCVQTTERLSCDRCHLGAETTFVYRVHLKANHRTRESFVLRIERPVVCRGRCAGGTPVKAQFGSIEEMIKIPSHS